MKVMRWFSWFEAWKFYSVDFFSLKMVLEAYITQHKAAPVVEAMPVHLRAQGTEAQLKELKSSVGTWHTAHAVITAETAWQARAMMVAAQPLWRTQAERLQHYKTPAENLKYAANMASGGWRRELKDIVVETLNSAACLETLGLPAADAEVQQHFLDFILQLLNTRGASLAAFEEPPRSLAALCSEEAGDTAADRLKEEWRILLEVEKRQVEEPAGEHSPLVTVHWGTMKVCRYILALLETDSNEACKVAAGVFSNLGDEKSVEDQHQHIRDTDRKCRHLQTSLPMKQLHGIFSKVIQQKKVEHHLPSEQSVLKALTEVDEDQS